MVLQREYDLQIQPDSHNHRYRVWFYFSISNVRKKQVVVLNITNFSKGKSLYREGMTPLVRSTSRPHWQRMPSRNTFYYKCPRHNSYVLTFVFEFDLEEDVYYFAYCYPYTYTDLQRYLHSIDSMQLPFYKRELLCRTMQHRRIDMLIIGDDPRSQNEDGDNKRPPRNVVCITARVHPGETPASYMCHGLIELVISNDPIAKKLRKHITFIIVPMLNPDGVFLGNYRTAFCGLDLNRQVYVEWTGLWAVVAGRVFCSLCCGASVFKVISAKQKLNKLKHRAHTYSTTNQRHGACLKPTTSKNS